LSTSFTGVPIPAGPSQRVRRPMATQASGINEAAHALAELVTSAT
jgi:hypothetical protein